MKIQALICASVIGVIALSCASGPRHSRALRATLASADSASARERAPDLIAMMEVALNNADSAEGAGDEAAAGDHATRARLLWQAAEAEAARIGDEQTRRALEEDIARALARAREDEVAREELSQEEARRIGAGTAREEALRALQQAEEDEARGARRTRVSLEDAQDIRRGAAALRARARLTLAAAVALGASADATATARATLEESEGATEPLVALHAADRAHHEALRALGTARGEREGPGPDGAHALAEAAVAEGFETHTLPEGVAVEAPGLFRGNAINPARNARLERLVSLIAAHPHGPIQVQAQVREAGPRGETLSTRRGTALRAALVAAGADGARLSVQPIPSSLRADPAIERGRLVFVAYSAPVH